MNERLLWIDTCGEHPGVALSVGEAIVGVRELGRKSASLEIVPAIRELLKETGSVLQALQAVGVVSGPGSFTGMRVGLAAAKGLCEAAGLRLAAVSSLEVLADAAGIADGYAVLDAGRGDLYVRETRRDAAFREFLCVAADLEGLLESLAGRPIVAGDAKSAEALRHGGAVLRPITVTDALPAILRARRADPALVEANYVRQEQDIYPRKPLP